jgi:hypothetical protein
MREAASLLLSDEVDCPWCIARAGEGCYIQQGTETFQSTRAEGSRQMIHLTRVVRQAGAATTPGAAAVEERG